MVGNFFSETYLLCTFVKVHQLSVSLGAIWLYINHGILHGRESLISVCSSEIRFICLLYLISLSFDPVSIGGVYVRVKRSRKSLQLSQSICKIFICVSKYCKWRFSNVVSIPIYTVSVAYIEIGIKIVAYDVIFYENKNSFCDRFIIVVCNITTDRTPFVETPALIIWFNVTVLMHPD